MHTISFSNRESVRNGSRSLPISCLCFGLAVTVLFCFTLTTWSLITTHSSFSISARYWRSNLRNCPKARGAVEQASNTRSSNLAADALFWVEFARQDASSNGMAVSPDCNLKLGDTFLEGFTNSSGTVCGRRGDTASWVDCFAYPVKQQGLGCIVNNLQLNGHSFMGQGPPAGAAAHDAYVPAGNAGSVRLGCRLNSSSHPVLAANLQKEQLPWLKSALSQAGTEEVVSNCTDMHDKVDHPVVFVSRLDTTNPYHHTQSVVQTFLTLAAAGKGDPANRFRQIQVLIADHFPEGPYMELWRRLSHPYPVVHLASSSIEGSCFRKAVLAHYATPSNAFLGYEGVGQEYTCPSTLLLAVSHWLRYLFLNSLVMPQQELLGNEQARLHASHVLNIPAGHQRLNVVFVSRSWFERSMMAGGGLTGWQQQRALAPEKENMLTQAIQQAVQKWNLLACVPPSFGWWQEPKPKNHIGGCKPTNVTFEFQVAELSLMELYPSQVLMFAKTAVLVAAHGAALTNMVYMRPHKGAVVELWYGNYHYVNQAHMLGHKHVRATPDAASVTSAVLEALEHVSSRY